MRDRSFENRHGSRRRSVQGLFPVNPASGGSVLTDLVSTNTVNGGLAKINYHVNDKNQFEAMYFISQGDTNSVDSPVSELSNIG